MPEIFRFTQLREPTGINVEEVRQNHIQFFKYIEEVEKMTINKSFKENFEKGIKSTTTYINSNKGFQDRSKLPNATITGKWESPLNESHKVFFELSYLLSQYNSDKKENKNEDLFSQMSEQLEKLDDGKIEEAIKGFTVYFEDLLVLYFHSGKYPSYLRLLTKLRKWHFVFSTFSLDKIKDSFKNLPKSINDLEVDSPLYFLIKAKILLPKYLFAKPKKKKPKDPTDVPNEKPKDEPIPLPDPVKKKATKRKATPRTNKK